MSEALTIDPNELRWTRHALTKQDIWTGRETVKQYRNRTWSVLSKYHKDGHIDDWQAEAGSRLQDHWDRAVRPKRIITHYGERIPSGERREMTDGQVEARQALNRVIARLGEVSASVAVNVCCFDMSAGDWATAHGERREYGMGRLREALTDLADIYGIPGRPKARK